MNRGSVQIGDVIFVNLAPSMRPRFMNRGSNAGRRTSAEGIDLQ